MEEDFEKKALLGREIMWKLNDFFDDEEWTLDKLRNIYMTFLPEGKNMIENFDDLFDRYAKGQDLNAPSYRIPIMNQVARLVNIKLGTMDNITRLAAMCAANERTPVPYSFEDFSPGFYTRSFDRPGTFGYISSTRGKPLGMGKTDVACKMIEFFLGRGFRVQTNILIKDPPEGLDEVRSLKAMVAGMVRNMMSGHKTINVLDEFSQFIEKERGTSHKYVNLKKALFLFRKMGGSLIVINQRDAEVPNAIIEMSSWHIQKFSKPLMRFRSEGRNLKIGDVPGTSLKFETYDHAGFIPDDLNISDMHDQIVTENEGESQLEAIMGYLNINHGELSKHHKKICAKVLSLSKGGYTQKEIAEVCGVTQSTICVWLKEMGVTASA